MDGKYRNGEEIGIGERLWEVKGSLREGNAEEI
jgi:hypothetical protein